jgi:3-methyladenine DNA glycosylase AlkD
MTLAEAMSELQSLGTEQNRNTYVRHGSGPNVFGVSFANFGKLTKKVKIDHPLALELWASGNFDARLWATMIADPSKVTGKLADEWVKQVDCAPVSDAVSKLVAASPVAEEKAGKWSQSKDEWIGATGWTLIASLAQNKNLADALFEGYIPVIEREIHTSKNRIRHSMNGALISIGTRGPKLQRAATAAAKRIGKVEVDHGDTGCKTPDAVAYIQKVAARAKK